MVGILLEQLAGEVFEKFEARSVMCKLLLAQIFLEIVRAVKDPRARRSGKFSVAAIKIVSQMLPEIRSQLGVPWPLKKWLNIPATAKPNSP